MYTTKELCKIRLDFALGLENKLKQSLYKLSFDYDYDIDKCIYGERVDLVRFLGKDKFDMLLASINKFNSNFVFEELSKNEVLALTEDNKNFPQDFLNLHFVPFVIYAKGNLKLLECENKVALVGSRKNIPLSIGIAESFAKGLCKNNVTVVTGCADGVDKAVIESALSINGNVISILAGGHDRVYPKANVHLVERVFEKGLVLSEYPLGTNSMPYMFPVRNRLIASLSKGTVVISAGLKSGTMHTASCSAEIGKDVFAVPYNVNVESGKGCNELIKHGALLVDSYKDVLSFYGIEEKPESTVVLSAEEKVIIKALKNGELHIEKLSSLTGINISVLISLISMMEIKGMVIKTATNTFGLRQL